MQKHVNTSQKITQSSIQEANLTTTERDSEIIEISAFSIILQLLFWHYLTLLLRYSCFNSIRLFASKS